MTNFKFFIFSAAISISQSSYSAVCTSEVNKRTAGAEYLLANYGAGIVSWGFFNRIENNLEFRYYPQQASLNCIGSLKVSDLCEVKMTNELNCWEPARGPQED